MQQGPQRTGGINAILSSNEDHKVSYSATESRLNEETKTASTQEESLGG